MIISEELFNELMPIGYIIEIYKDRDFNPPYGK